MHEQTPFSKGITEYISMALHIWPALQLSLPNLHEAYAPPQGSPIPNRKYSEMQAQQFMKTIIQDLHDYILQHDVKAEHIIEYLEDLLAIFNAEQQNPKTMAHMAQQLVLLIQQLPEGDNSRLVNFRFVYNALKGHNIGHVVKVEGEQNQDDGSQSHSSEDSEDNERSDQEEQQANENNIEENISQQVPKLIQQNQAAKEDDDGWVVVKKKSRR